MTIANLARLHDAHDVGLDGVPAILGARSEHSARARAPAGTSSTASVLCLRSSCEAFATVVGILRQPPLVSDERGACALCCACAHLMRRCWSVNFMLAEMAWSWA